MSSVCSQVSLSSVSVSIPPTSNEEKAAKSCRSPTVVAAVRSPPPSCPFSRLAPAGTSCPVTGALAPTTLVALPREHSPDAKELSPVIPNLHQSAAESDVSDARDESDSASAVPALPAALVPQSPSLEAEPEEEPLSVERTPAPVVVARTRVKRCPWWARLLRYTAKACAKHVVMRSLKPLVRNSVRTVLHVVKNTSTPTLAPCPLGHSIDEF